MSEDSRVKSSSPLPSFIFRISAAVAAVEKVVASLLIAAVAVLILLNVFTRYAGYALYWVDELAIYTMVWAALVAGSLSVRRRMLISVTLVIDVVGRRVQRAMLAANDVIMLVFSCFLIWLCWIWFNPWLFAQAGFDVGTFVMETGNFIYGEPTNTLGIRKVWLWLIMPVFAFTVTIHSLANTIETIWLGNTEPYAQPDGSAGQ
ncbi:MAG: TRAP transporter small permease subunit [Aquisalimonadaceae bacterium]